MSETFVNKIQQFENLDFSTSDLQLKG